MIQSLSQEAIGLLEKLIETPSFSKEEEATAKLIQDFLHQKGVKCYRKGNNIWAFNQHHHPNKPTLLLNSHHDTVKPNQSYTRNPFKTELLDGKLYGLGSNDAGGALVSLMAAFIYFYPQTGLKYNLILACTAEEENSGTGGIESILNEIGKIDLAIVGEPTSMNLAAAEKGLLVLDCISKGKSGHAARAEGDNAIYKALADIEWFRTYQFPKVSDTLGPMKMSVTMIQSGTQHNVVPDTCQFTVDVRVTDVYTHEDVLTIIRQNVQCEVNPRSMRLRSSSISNQHSLVQAGLKFGRTTYGSPTTSDQALIPATSLKLGPGDSARSHTADEFIYIHEIEEGVELYVKILEEIVVKKKHQTLNSK